MSAPGDRPLGRIVIVEDDPFLLEQLTWALKGKFDVTAARDADAGPRALRVGPGPLPLRPAPAAVRTRPQEGLDLLRHVRRRDPDATVVMMSGEGERAPRARGDRARRLRLLPEAGRHGGAARHPESRRSSGGVWSSRTASSAGRPARRLAGLRPARRARAPRCSGSCGDREGRPDRRDRPAPGRERDAARSSSPTRSTRAAPGATAPSSRSTPRRFPSRSPSPSSSATRRAPSPAPSPRARAVSSWPHGGTLFLDEIGTLSPASRRSSCAPSRAARSSGSAAGGRSPWTSGSIAATNEDLEARVAAGTFREDLFYRINTIPIRDPAAARARGTTSRSSRTTSSKRSAPARGEAAQEALARGRSSGSRRTRGAATCASSQHAIEMLVLFSEGGEIGEEDLPRALRGARQRRRPACRDPDGLRGRRRRLSSAGSCASDRRGRRREGARRRGGSGSTRTR